jgi:50S ribosomal protein 5
VTKIEDMPLESKQKMIMEQRARMKLAKKLRQAAAQAASPQEEA